LDKTGTITLGKPSVTDIFTLNDFNQDDVLQLAASLETQSEHPLAKAIVHEAKAKALPLQTPQAFVADSGLGIQAKLDEKNALLGNAAWLHKNHIQIDTVWEQQEERFAKQAKTPVYLVLDKHIVGMIAIADPIKPESKQAIQTLKSQHLKIMMLTGDKQATAQAIADEVGIDSIIAGVLPQDKDSHIAKLQADGDIVGMVGDGINDAAALARADVGFAMASGTDIAMEAADITLIHSSLDAIPNAIAISRATIKNIHQNLFGAFVYNALAIPIAAGVLYPFLGILLNPMIAGAAMAMSSVTVVSNANRLRFFQPSSTHTP